MCSMVIFFPASRHNIVETSLNYSSAVSFPLCQLCLSFFFVPSYPRLIYIYAHYIKTVHFFFKTILIKKIIICRYTQKAHYTHHLYTVHATTGFFHFFVLISLMAPPSMKRFHSAHKNKNKNEKIYNKKTRTHTKIKYNTKTYELVH